MLSSSILKCVDMIWLAEREATDLLCVVVIQMIQTHLQDMIELDNVVEGGMQELLYLDDFHRNVNRTGRNPIPSQLAHMTTEHLPGALSDVSAMQQSPSSEEKLHQGTTFCHGLVKDIGATDPVDIPVRHHPNVHTLLRWDR